MKLRLFLLFLFAFPAHAVAEESHGDTKFKTSQFDFYKIQQSVLGTRLEMYLDRRPELFLGRTFGKTILRVRLDLDEIETGVLSNSDHVLCGLSVKHKNDAVVTRFIVDSDYLAATGGMDPSGWKFELALKSKKYFDQAAKGFPSNSLREADLSFLDESLQRARQDDSALSLAVHNIRGQVHHRLGFNYVNDLSFPMVDDISLFGSLSFRQNNPGILTSYFVGVRTSLTQMGPLNVSSQIRMDRLDSGVLDFGNTFVLSFRF